ncbi:flagellar protein FliT [Bacillaceae bacterium Marseille-Q3522]|nr:flagellar protein FliT [Bacillaceae bacterium Marseille-Q3522]
MPAVQDYYESTEQLIQLLETGSGLERDKKIAEIEKLLDKRQAYMTEIHPPYSEAEIEIGKKTLELENKLSQLLQREKTYIQKDIQMLHKKKDHNKKYVNPYQNLNSNGFFYDKRR